MAGIFTQTVAFGVAITAIGLADDLHKGIIDRFRSLPMARSAVLVGRTTSDLVQQRIVMLVMSLCGLLVGWRIHRGVGYAIAAYVIMFAVCVRDVMGLGDDRACRSPASKWRRVPASSGCSRSRSCRTHLSRRSTLPGWLPAGRELESGERGGGGCPRAFGNNGLRSRAPAVADDSTLRSRRIGWSALLLVVFIPLSVRKYREAAAR